MEYTNDLIGIKGTSQYFFFFFFFFDIKQGSSSWVATREDQDNIGDRAFCVADPKLWNSLPTNIRNSRTFNKFSNAFQNVFV